MVTFLIAVALCAEPPCPTIEDRYAAEPTMAGYMHLTAMQHRRANGLFDQRLDDDLTAIAQAHADWMAANHNMSHGSQDNIIAMGQGSAEEAMTTWMNSSGHRFWLLSRTTRAGWGCQRSSSGALYWCGAFRGEAVANESGSDTMTYSNRKRGIFRRR